MEKKDKSFQCSQCGLHYQNEETAKNCEAWCREHNSCNLEITKYSMERASQKAKQGQKPL